MPNVMQFYGSNTKQATPAMNTFQRFNLQMPQLSRPAGNLNPTLGGAVDDMQLNRHTPQDQAKRYRRRSIHTIDAGDYLTGGGNPISAGLVKQGSRQVSSANGRIDQQQQHPLRSSPVVAVRPASSRGQNGSTDSVNSTRSNSRPNSVSYPSKKQCAHRNNTIYPSPN
jgi:hypothetical protein